MEHNEIIKALECCKVGDDCWACPYDNVGVYSQCVPKLLEDALALIKELTEENERLRADTIDEFVKMMKEKMREVATGKRTSLIGTGWIDEIARELKGE